MMFATRWKLRWGLGMGAAVVGLALVMVLTFGVLSMTVFGVVYVSDAQRELIIAVFFAVVVFSYFAGIATRSVFMAPNLDIIIEGFGRMELEVLTAKLTDVLSVEKSISGGAK